MSLHRGFHVMSISTSLNSIFNNIKLCSQPNRDFTCATTFKTVPRKFCLYCSAQRRISSRFRPSKDSCSR